MTPDDIAVIDEIIDAGNKLYARGYVAANDGNISARAADGGILITPTMVSKGGMTRDMIIKLDADSGDVLDGTRKPSSECGMHLRLYRENPKIMAAVHAHPVTATSFAIAREPLDKPIYPAALYNLGCVPVACYASPGTPEVAESVAPFARDYKAVLLANHGALTWGENVLTALYRMEELENYARLTLNTVYIMGKATLLTPKQQKEVTGG